LTLGVIDIGTNTVLLLVARLNQSEEIATLAYEQRIPRLGRGVDATKRIHRDGMERVILVLQEYRSILRTFPVEKIIVAGTSAVRDAANRQEFSELIQKHTGFDLEVLSGKEEALWTYRGAISGVTKSGNATVIDIGGGSTEITQGDTQAIYHAVSLDIGSVRLTERFFLHDPPVDTEIEAAAAFVTNALSAVRFSAAGSTPVAVAGTATTLAVLDQHAEAFTVASVTNYRLRLDRVSALLEQLRTMSSAEIEKLSSVMHGRSDVITAGALILREVMNHFEFDSVIVSERGVRYGLAIREWERKRLKDMKIR